MAANGSQPAHPTIEQSGDNYQNWITTAGLTKRELIAAMAMQGLLSAWGNHEVTEAKDLAHDAVVFADALLKKLESRST